MCKNNILKFRDPNDFEHYHFKYDPNAKYCKRN